MSLVGRDEFCLDDFLFCPDDFGLIWFVSFQFAMDHFVYIG